MAKKIKYFRCTLCDETQDRFKTIEGLCDHLEKEHSDMIPKDFTPLRFAYYLRTGKMEGSCVMCKKPTDWNESTGKYNRFCNNPKCKEKYREIFKQRMIGKYGKVSLLDDPEQQKKMLANRKISGVYTWTDGGKTNYTGSYELDFLKMLDLLMNYSSKDVMGPSPHIYYYTYQGRKHFYIPDFFIPSLSLEIEIKDGGDNPNQHGKIQAVDKAKEKLKDSVMTSQREFSYVKITNKEYNTFIEFLLELKGQYKVSGDDKNTEPIFILGESMTEDVLEEEAVDESMVFSKDNMEYNVEEFGSKYNVLLITGLSGGGKSTLARKMGEERNAIVIEIDWFDYNQFLFSKKDLTKGEEVVKKYFEKTYHGARNLNSKKGPKYYEALLDFLETIIKNAKKDKKNLYIIEGIQIGALASQGMLTDEVKELPVIIVGTSIVKALFRRMRRGGVMNFVSYLSPLQYFEWYKDMDKDLDCVAGLKTTVGESSEEDIVEEEILEESDLPFKLYHGSKNLFDELRPFGIDFGNSLQGVGWSLFTWTSYKSAMGWGCWEVFRHLKKIDDNVILNGCLNSQTTVVWESVYNYLKENIHKYSKEDLTFYVYTIPTKTEYEYGLGHSSNTPNCVTIRTDHIKYSKVDKYVMTMDMVDEYCKVAPDGYEPTNKEYGQNKRLTSFLMKHDFMYQPKLRKSIHKAIENGDLKPGDDLSAFLKDNNIDLKKVGFKERLADIVSRESYAEDEIMEESNNSIPTFKSDEELFDFMKKNISYKNYTRLMSPEEVYEAKKGSCHDQVMFELYCLRKMKLKPKALFLIEYNKDGNGTSNMTHSLVYYEKDGKICWFENAWGGNEGIHKFNSVAELKEKLNKMHENGKWGNVKQYPELEITSFKSHKTGETLQQFVDTCLGESYVEESISIDNLYHLSQSNLDGKVLTPRIPSNFLVDNRYEDGETKRVCFSNSIDGCLRGMSQNLKGMKLYVHTPEKECDVYRPTTKEVPDCKVTGEVWVKKPVKLKCIGLIKVTGDRGEDGIPYTYGDDNVAELYDWDYKWIDRYDNEVITEATKSTIDNNYKSKGKKNLSSFKIEHITEAVINKYKKEYPFLSHVRCKDTKEYICDGYIWFDNDELVAMVGSCEYIDDKTKWVVSLEITNKYRGYGLSKQILDYAVKSMGCKYLSVNKNNKIAKKVYDDYGFKVYHEDDTMYYMTIDKNIKESSTDEQSLLVEASKKKETSKRDLYEITLGRFRGSVIIDYTNKEFIVKGINYNKFLLRLKEMYKARGVVNLFEKNYSWWSQMMWEKEKIKGSDRKIISLKVPLFFALEIYKIFLDLANFYGLYYYKNIAKKIYVKTWISNFEGRKKDARSIDLSPLSGLRFTSKEYQEEFIKEYQNLKYIYDLEGYILSFDQGLGKTFTAIGLSEVLKAQQVVIVCPNSLKENWAYEIRSYFDKYFNDEYLWKEEVYVVGDSKYRYNKSTTKYVIVNQESISKAHNYVKKSGVMIVVDESHNFRNIDSKRSQELLKLKQMTNCKDNLLMSGTPLKATPDELIPALRMIDPYFTEDLAKIYKKTFNIDSSEISRVVRERFDRSIYRKTKAEVLSLPERYVGEIKYKIPNPEKYSIKRLKEEIKLLANTYYEELYKEAPKLEGEFTYLVRKYSTASKTLTEQYLKYIKESVQGNIQEIHEHRAEVYDNFLKTLVYTNANISESEIKRLEYLKKQYINMSKVAMGKAIGAVLPKARTQCYIDLYTVNRKDIISRIENNTKKTIIFTPFLDVAHFICDDLNKNKVGCVKVVGETKNRMDVLVDFKTNDDIDVLVATTQTLSTGVTLTEATLMLFFGTPYRSADFNQACDRIHRIGQTNDVYIYKVLLDSPEKNVTERINEILGWSEDMFDSMIGNTGLNESMDLYVLEDIFESSRALLPDEAFGVSDLRKFPLDTEKHVRSAIKFFNYVDKEHEKELASKIIKKMKEYNITDVKIGEKNRLGKYLNLVTEDVSKRLINGDNDKAAVSLKATGESPYNVREMIDKILHGNPFFISDIHMEINTPKGLEKFENIVNNINSSVDENESLFILGDMDDHFIGEDSTMVEVFLDRLKCKNVYLILGNHDMAPVKDYVRFGFKGITDVLRVGNLIISHIPMAEIPDDMINIHGHLHGDVTRHEEYAAEFDDRYYDVWNNEYKPQRLSEILQKISIKISALDKHDIVSEDVDILEMDVMLDFVRRTKDALKTIIDQALPSLRDNFNFDIESDDGGYFFAWYKNIDDDIITQIVTALNGALDESPYRVSIKTSSNGGIFWLYQPSERTTLIDESVNDILAMII